MSEQDFDNQLRAFVRRRPFFPFVVVFLDGREITVDLPNAIAFDVGGAGFISETKEIVLFECEEVSRIVAATESETAL